MPTYEYACASCGHQFEAFQSMTARPLRKCPQCQQRSLKRLVGTGAGVIFKGSGFYETDYNRSKEYKDAVAKENQGDGQKEGSEGSGQSQSDQGGSSSQGGESGGQQSSGQQSSGQQSTGEQGSGGNQTSSSS